MARWLCYIAGVVYDARNVRTHTRPRKERTSKRNEEIHLANDINDVTCNTIFPLHSVQFHPFHRLWIPNWSSLSAVVIATAVVAVAVVSATQTLSLEIFQWNLNIIYLASHQIVACIIFLNRKTIFQYTWALYRWVDNRARITKNRITYEPQRAYINVTMNYILCTTYLIVN